MPVSKGLAEAVIRLAVTDGIVTRQFVTLPNDYYVTLSCKLTSCCLKTNLQNLAADWQGLGGPVLFADR
jgi:hypothetical protein